jgi:hypothetical protein
LHPTGGADGRSEQPWQQGLRSHYLPTGLERGLAFSFSGFWPSKGSNSSADGPKTSSAVLPGMVVMEIGALRLPCAS